MKWKSSLLFLFLFSIPAFAKSSLSSTTFQVDDDALAIRNDFLYLRYGVSETGVSASVGVNQLASTINSTTTHEVLATIAAIKTYVDDAIQTVRNSSDSAFDTKVYGGEMVGAIKFSPSQPMRKGVSSTKWILCDGRTLSISSYPELYALLGTRYGGNGSTTFGIPNLEKRMLFGTGTIGSDSFLLSSPTGGSETKSLSISEMPSHTHSITDPGHIHTVDAYYRTDMDHVGDGSNDDYDLHNVDKGSTTYSSGSKTTGISINNTGSGTAYSLMQPYRVIKAYIRVLP